MADAEGTAGQVIGGLSPLLSAIPFVGPALSAFASIGSGALQSAAAKQQATQAANIRQQALNTPKEELQPAFLSALHLNQMKALGGLPGMGDYTNDLNNQLADQIRYIRMAAPGGNAALAAMSRAVATKNTQYNNLQAQDAAYRQHASDAVGDNLWKIGEQGVDLNKIRDTERTQGLTAAAAMENASMLNKQGGYNTAAFGASGGANQILNNLMKLGAAGGNTSTTGGVTGNTSTAGLFDNQTAAGLGTATSPALSVNNWLSSTSPGTPMTSDSIFNAGFSTGGTGSSLPPSLSIGN